MGMNPTRVQSASSINMYKQCPRKYFYRYIAKLPTKPSIHTTRGTIVHSVLEDFYDTEFTDGVPVGDKLIAQSMQLLDKHWTAKDQELKSLGLNKHELQNFYEESKIMVHSWVFQFLHKLSAHAREHEGDLLRAFDDMKPIREGKYVSDSYSVMGFIDAIETHTGKIRLMDYKTSKKDQITEEYRLQLGLYSLLYHDKHRTMPDEVGLYLLKHGERVLPVTQELIDLAKFEVEMIHMNTQSKNIRDYPKHVSPLCKWSSGQCDFYETCFGKTLNDY
ncbi:MAG: RecB family exonuclease [Nanoarchaeota archaeon]